jgi:hypothetical protein
MRSDPLVGKWRKVALNGTPLIKGYELLHLRADGTASIEGEWLGKAFGSTQRWQRVDDRHWRSYSLIPAGASPGVEQEVLNPGYLHEIIELSSSKMRLALRLSPEVKALAHRWMISQGHLRPSDAMPDDDQYDYERVSELDGGGE